ncbi:MAG: hypothetical protein IPP86_00240 [Bacteroidetes bacterium]|nr:hypothetical protein [Bacteroidota bacterium]
MKKARFTTTEFLLDVVQDPSYHPIMKECENTFPGVSTMLREAVSGYRPDGIEMSIDSHEGIISTRFGLVNEVGSRCEMIAFKDQELGGKIIVSLKFRDIKGKELQSFSLSDYGIEQFKTALKQIKNIGLLK